METDKAMKEINNIIYDVYKEGFQDGINACKRNPKLTSVNIR